MSKELVPQATLDTVTSGVIESFNHVLLQVDDYRQELAEAGDWEALTHGLKNLLEFRDNLVTVLQSIEKNIYDLMPEKKMIVENVGIVEKRRSSSKKWDSEKLLSDIVRRTLDNGTGEITPADVFRLVDTLKTVLPITPSLGWRVTALKEICDPDFYCEISWGRPTIQMTKPNK